MQKFADEYNRLLPGNERNVSDLFVYDTTLNTFALNGGRLREYVEA